jgi:hypothetical protein
MKNETTSVRLSVLEERMNTMCKQNNADHAEILEKINEINIKLDKMYVTRLEIEPIKKKLEDHDKIFVTLGSVVFLAVLGAILKLVIH